MVTPTLEIKYQGQDAAVIAYDTATGISDFQYEPSFVKSGVELAPLMMPLKNQPYSFPYLNPKTFKGMPGLIADSLPDAFGNAVLNAWVASQGRDANTITPLERLQYTGNRAMGALEFSPPKFTRKEEINTSLELGSLVAVAQEMLDSRQQFKAHLKADGSDEHTAMKQLVQVGMSAGGARPKAVLAFNKGRTRVRSGQVDAPEGYAHCLLKFDGVTEHRAGQETFGDPLGFGAMEYTYYQMAIACGIKMMPCELLDEGSRRHFVTQRFDRIGNKKVHVQTLNGMAHVDFNQPGSFSYEELFGVMRKLKLKAKDAEELLRRLVFNIVARNHDDHAKNFAFALIDNEWKLAPAYDLAYSYKPGSPWVDQHWMSLNQKRDHFTRQDFYQLASLSPLFSQNKIDELLERTIAEVARWSVLAKENGVPEALVAEVQSNLRLQF